MSSSSSSSSSLSAPFIVGRYVSVSLAVASHWNSAVLYCTVIRMSNDTLLLRSQAGGCGSSTNNDDALCMRFVAR